MCPLVDTCIQRTLEDSSEFAYLTKACLGSKTRCSNCIDCIAADLHLYAHAGGLSKLSFH
jgi:hypothetical protein